MKDVLQEEYFLCVCCLMIMSRQMVIIKKIKMMLSRLMIEDKRMTILTIKFVIILEILLFLAISIIDAQNVCSDNGDGTYTNPVIPADFPDPDVICVGDTYYMVTTTMWVFPGVTV